MLVQRRPRRQKGAGGKTAKAYRSARVSERMLRGVVAVRRREEVTGIRRKGVSR